MNNKRIKSTHKTKKHKPDKPDPFFSGGRKTKLSYDDGDNDSIKSKEEGSGGVFGEDEGDGEEEDDDVASDGDVEERVGKMLHKQQMEDSGRLIAKR
nr:hypothetical protein [Tanacetum cinerariifolium]